MYAITIVIHARGQRVTKMKLTADEINTIRIHMNAIKEELWNRGQYKEAWEYQTIVDKLDDIQPSDDRITNALRKQEPMVPDVYGDGYADGAPVYDTWECPSCGATYEIEGQQYDFCPNCGQKIDWNA